MARSKFDWLVVFEDGTPKIMKAQTLWQIMNCDEIGDTDQIMSVTRTSLSDDYEYDGKMEVIDIPFVD